MRVIVGCLVGMAAAVVVVFVGEAIGHTAFPPPAGIDVSDPKSLAILISQLPIGAVVAVLVSWAAGAFVGGGIAARITRRQWSAWFVGLSMLAAGFATMLAIPHPTWFAIAAVPAALAPAWLAGRLFSQSP